MNSMTMSDDIAEELRRHYEWCEDGAGRPGSLRGRVLRNADLSHANLAHLDLTAANLENAHLLGARAAAARLRFAVLRGADWRTGLLFDADLRGADMGGADFSGADLHGALLRGALLEGAKMSGVKGLDPIEVVGCRWPSASKEHASAIGLWADAKHPIAHTRLFGPATVDDSLDRIVCPRALALELIRSYCVL